MWQRNYHGLAGTRRVSGCDAEMVAKVLSRTKITCDVSMHLMGINIVWSMRMDDLLGVGGGERTLDGLQFQN